jgi:hypothetical protein
LNATGKLWFSAHNAHLVPRKKSVWYYHGSTNFNALEFDLNEFLKPSPLTETNISVFFWL